MVTWLLMHRYTHKTHFSVNYAAEDEENSAETARPVVPWSIRTPLWLYQLALPALKKSDLSALYASKGLCFSKQVRRGPLTAYKDGQSYRDITLVWKYPSWSREIVFFLIFSFWFRRFLNRTVPYLGVWAFPELSNDWSMCPPTRW